MASPTAAGMQALFPQFSSHSDAQLEAWFAQAVLRFTAARFGAQWTMAVYLYTAHQISCFDPLSANNDGDHVSRGPVSSESILDQSMSYGSTVDMSKVGAGSMEFTSTKYGQQLIGIINSRAASRGFVVRTGSSRATVGSS